MGNLRSLRTLDVSENLVRELPPALAQARTLEVRGSAVEWLCARVPIHQWARGGRRTVGGEGL